MHNKTYMTAIGWILSVGGWFFWTAVLSVIFKPNKTYPLYPIYQDFTEHYGRDFAWWLVLFLILASLTLFELGVSSVRKAFWPTDTDVFQELQKDKIIKERFEETVRREHNGEGPAEMERGGDRKTSEDLLRESLIQELLDRPRVMNATVDTTISRSTTGSLHRRRVSQDIGGSDIEMGLRNPINAAFTRSVEG